MSERNQIKTTNLEPQVLEQAAPVVVVKITRLRSCHFAGVSIWIAAYNQYRLILTRFFKCLYSHTYFEEVAIVISTIFINSSFSIGF